MDIVTSLKNQILDLADEYKPVDDPITNALNAASILGQYHGLMDILSHICTQAWIDVHDATTGKINKLLVIQNSIYRR